MGKFQQKQVQPQVSAPAATPTPAPTVEADPVLIAQNNHAIAAGLGDVLAESDTPAKDVDKPNTKFMDQDFSNSTMFAGGKRMIQTDALARALNAEVYLLDVSKPWGHNPLGGRPVAINFTREFPDKKILYDHIDSSPETNTKGQVEKIVKFKMQLANDHGYMYLYQHQWATLTTEELDKQLFAQRELMKQKK